MGLVPITIGSGIGDVIQAEGVPQAAVEFKLENGIIRCMENGQSREIAPGTRIQVGKLGIVVCTPEFPFTGAPQVGSGRGVPSPGPQRPGSPSPFSNPNPNPTRPSSPSPSPFSNPSPFSTPMPSSSSAPSPFSNPMPSNPTTPSYSASPTPTPADRDIGRLPVAPSKPSPSSVADSSLREGKSIPLPTRKRG